MTMQSFLSVQNLNAFYGDFQALFDVSFSLEEGQTIAIIGANGAGKSTLLHALLGQVSKTTTAATFDGLDLNHAKTSDIVGHGIALVPEGRHLFKSCSVLENLELGAGYWLRFDAEGENMVTGGDVSEIPVTLAAGWNLISGGSETMGVETISDPDGIVVANTLYGFGVGYEGSDELVPGHGYWIRTTAAGDVVIGGASARSREFVDRLKNASSISFNGKVLYFDATVPEAEKLSYSLPPVPPAGAFDVRYSDDLIYTGSIGNIVLMNPYGELNVSYQVAGNSKWILTSAAGDIFELSGSGHFSMPNIENAEFTLVKSEISIEPVIFGLQGSYPNPFNPTTTINYSVETEGLTSLIVYDMMGREIKSLVSGYLTPNHYSVVWNGKDNSDRKVPSGIYLYRLTSGEFTDMKKVMLLK